MCVSFCNTWRPPPAIIGYISLLFCRPRQEKVTSCRKAFLSEQASRKTAIPPDIIPEEGIILEAALLPEITGCMRSRGIYCSPCPHVGNFFREVLPCCGTLRGPRSRLRLATGPLFRLPLRRRVCMAVAGQPPWTPGSSACWRPSHTDSRSRNW
jgi:hypothetical protein